MFQNSDSRQDNEEKDVSSFSTDVRIYGGNFERSITLSNQRTSVLMNGYFDEIFLWQLVSFFLCLICVKKIKRFSFSLSLLRYFRSNSLVQHRSLWMGKSLYHFNATNVLFIPMPSGIDEDCNQLESFDF